MNKDAAFFIFSLFMLFGAGLFLMSKGEKISRIISLIICACGFAGCVLTVYAPVSVLPQHTQVENHGR